MDCALLNSIARLDPECHIEVLSQPGVSNLLEETPFIDRIHVRAPGALQDIWQQYGLLRNKWDVVLVTRYNPRLQLFYHFAKAKHKRCYRYTETHDGAPQIVTRMSMLEGILEGWKDVIDPTIHFRPERIENVIQIHGLNREKRYLAIAPGASYDEKRWDEHKFVELGKSIANSFDLMLVLGSKEEDELCEFVANGIGGLNLAGKLELLDICALETLVSLHIGNDSGTGHLAAAGGTNVLAVGDAVGSAWVPWKQHMLLGDPKNIEVKEVIDFLKDKQLL